jgi:cyclase
VTTRRVVVCLDVQGGRVVKGVGFKGLREVGDPVELADRYQRDGADEIVFLDISATAEERAPLWDVVTRTAEQLFIPLVVGGGLASVEDAIRALRFGADKVSLNSAALRDPFLIAKTAGAVGSQCVIVSVDARQEGNGWQVFAHGGQGPTGRDAVAWAKEAVSLGAGELLVTSIDRDGGRAGYDLALTRAIADAVDVPVIASGGAGTGAHLVEVFRQGRAEAALVAGVLHDGTTSLPALKNCLSLAGFEVRGAPA